MTNRIINPTGNGNPQRPSNEDTLEFIRQQKAAQEAQELADNIVQMGEAQSPEVVERRRKQALVAFGITLQQLDSDAKTLEEAAKMPDCTVQDSHQKYDMARAFRMTMTWLQGLMGVAGGEKKSETT